VVRKIVIAMHIGVHVPAWRPAIWFGMYQDYELLAGNVASLLLAAMR
jgi:hypothetical protein